jgi:hypothetical protein
VTDYYFLGKEEGKMDCDKICSSSTFETNATSDTNATNDTNDTNVFALMYPFYPDLGTPRRP